MPKSVGLIPVKSRIAAIQSVYADASKSIVDILSGLDPMTFTTNDHGVTLRRVQKIILTLNSKVRAWAPGAIRAAYNESAGVARTRLELIGAKKLPPGKYNPSQHDRKIAALVKTVSRDLFKANRTMEKTAQKFLGAMGLAAAGVDKVLAQAQEFSSKQVKSFINRTIEAAIKSKTKYNLGTAHMTSKGIASKIKAKLMSQVDGGNFILINGRNYDIASYAELVARTRMREAQTEAVIESMKQFDEDLVEIPKHDNPCPDCAEYQGKIYSISGNSDKYDELPDGGPPWHPNCEDVMNPVSENALAWRGV